MLSIRQVLWIPVLIFISISGCALQNGGVKPPEPVVGEVPPRTREDKVWFEDKSAEMKLTWTMQPMELKTIPVAFGSPGALAVTNQSVSSVSLYLNQQENNERGSTKYFQTLQKKITGKMTRSDWYLHVNSDSDKPLIVVLALKFSPPKKDKCLGSRSTLDQARTVLERGRLDDLREACEWCNAVQRDCPDLRAEAKLLAEKISIKITKHDFNKISKLVGESKCSQARALLKNMDPSFDLHKQAKKLVAGCMKPTQPKPPVRKHDDDCAVADNLLSQSRSAFENNDLDTAHDMCLRINNDYDCPRIRNQAATFARTIRKKIDEKRIFDKIVTLIDRGDCRRARQHLPELELNPELYNRAEELIKGIEEPCPSLGSLSVTKTKGGRRIGEGVEGTGTLAQNQEKCYQVNLKTRGDLSVCIDMGYSIDGGQLDIAGVDPRPPSAGGKRRMRYRWLNVPPDTKLEVRLRNNDGNPNYTVQFYLYPDS